MGVNWSSGYQTTARSYYNGTRVYYNWRAATAGTTNGSFASGNAPGTVCPQQWTLPISGNNTGSQSFYNLFVTVYSLSTSSDSPRIQSIPFNFLRTGYYHYAYGEYRAENAAGCYWSRSVKDASNAYYLSVGANGFDPQYSGTRGDGYPIRCLAKP